MRKRLRASTIALLACSLLAGTLAQPARPALAAIGQVFVPNVTKTLGGPGGWTTPVAIQNVGLSPTDVTLSLFRFSDGTPVAQLRSPQLQPGQHWLFDPMRHANLPHDTQFALVAQATSGSAAAVVLEGSGSSWMAYSGTATGSSTVYLPNVTRRLGGPNGWDTPFIVQNLGSAETKVSVSFFKFADGALAKRIENVAIGPGRSRSFLPWTIDGLKDDAQYAVVVAGPPGSQLYAVVNEHQAAQAMSYEGLLGGAEVVYLPNIVKHLGGTAGWSTPFVVQNVGTQPATISISFHSFGSGALAARAEGITLQPGRSFAADVRFFPANLPASQYSVVIRGSAGAKLGAVVNQMELGAARAMSYEGIGSASPSAYLPFVQKANGPVRWVSPIIAQNLGPTASDVTITIFSPSGAVAAQRVYPRVAPGAAAVFDPREERRLAPGAYSALVQAQTAVAAVVNHSAGLAGDYAMAYTSVAGPQAPIPQAPPSTATVAGLTFNLRFTVHTDLYLDQAISPADAATLASAIDADVGQIAQDFGRGFNRLPQIYVFATEASYITGIEKILGYPAERARTVGKSTSALFSPARIAILVDWESVKQQRPLSVVRHELTHLMVRQIARTNPTVPVWLDEGLATAEEESLPGGRWLSLITRYGAASMAATGTLYPLEDLRSVQGWSTRTGAARYWLASQAVHLLRADLGQAGIVRILELMGEGKLFDDAYAEVAGRPFATFVGEFPRRIRALATSYPGIATAPDSVVGPGLTFVLYGFTPSSQVRLEVNSVTGASAATITVDELGFEWFYLGPEFSAGSYSIRAIGTNGTVQAIATKL